MERKLPFDRPFWMIAATGAFNLGLVGLARLNPVGAIFGRDSVPARISYGLVGLAALWSIYNLLTVTPLNVPSELEERGERGIGRRRAA